MDKDETQINTNTQNPEAVGATNGTSSSQKAAEETSQGARVEEKTPVSDERKPPREFKKNLRKGPRRESKVKPEFDQKIVSIRRVTRVVTGGRRFSFSVAMVAGNRKGSVGVGLGKASDTSLAIEKALRDAKKNMITVTLTKEGSIPHEVEAKYSSSRVFITPAPDRGIIAGSSVRTVLELSGLRDIGAKIRSGSKNKINNARAAIEALRKLPKTKTYASGMSKIGKENIQPQA